MDAATKRRDRFVTIETCNHNVLFTDVFVPSYDNAGVYVRNMIVVVRPVLTPRNPCTNVT